MTKFRRVILASTLAIAATGLASATTITGSVGDSTSIPGFSNPPTSSVNVTLHQFDLSSVSAAALAGCASGFTCSNFQFVSILFTIDAAATNTVIVNNANVTDKTIGKIGKTDPNAIESIADIILTDPNGKQVAESLPTFAQLATLTVHPGDNTFTGNPTDSETGTIVVSTGAFTSTTGLSGTLTSTQINNTYVGTSTITFSVGLTSLLSNGPLSAGLTIPTNNVSLTGNTVSVQYNYTYDSVANPTGTPEPATFALFGGALLGLGVLRKRIVR